MISAKESLREIFSQVLLGIKVKRNFRILVFTHRQADPDALCAASGLCLLLQREFPNNGVEFKIIAPQGASSLGQSVCSQLGITYANVLEEANLTECDLVFVVDTGDPHLLEPYVDRIRNCAVPKVLIDHHSLNLNQDVWSGFDATIVEREATSTCEIITCAFSSNLFSPEIARILLVGLMFDSQHLGIAKESTLDAALILVRAGAEVENARRILHKRASRSELIARVKSAQRLQYEEIGKYLVLRAEVSSFHASVARMLLEIGADIGIAYGESDGEARISVRSSQLFFKDTTIDIAEHVKQISESSGMIGGGHPTAASLSGKGDALKQANKLIQSLRKAIPQT
ncbi:MAG: DHH family phosphoesterase [Nitrososphaerota archaeon]|jgi:nanoRNase/pAp phosphatase (c-di-AMP/oligoRNAs hydrolase)|nr:DHH family phosphoesterase [Nitrososphaerota archaeon]